MSEYVMKPCPFCGNYNIAEDEGCFPSGNGFEVRCGNPFCYAHEPQRATFAEAIEVWNNRAAAPTPHAGEAIARVPTGHPTSVVEWLGPMPAPGTLLYTAPQPAAAAPREPVVYACPECGTGMEVDTSAKPAPREPSLDSQRKAAAETLVERFLFERDDSISDAERTDHERSESAKLIVKQVTELLQVAPREPAPAVGDEFKIKAGDCRLMHGDWWVCNDPEIPRWVNFPGSLKPPAPPVDAELDSFLELAAKWRKTMGDKPNHRPIATWDSANGGMRGEDDFDSEARGVRECAIELERFVVAIQARRQQGSVNG